MDSLFLWVVVWVSLWVVVGHLGWLFVSTLQVCYGLGWGLNLVQLPEHGGKEVGSNSPSGFYALLVLMQRKKRKRKH